MRKSPFTVDRIVAIIIDYLWPLTAFHSRAVNRTFASVLMTPEMVQWGLLRPSFWSDVMCAVVPSLRRTRQIMTSYFPKVKDGDAFVTMDTIRKVEIIGNVV